MARPPWITGYNKWDQIYYNILSGIIEIKQANLNTGQFADWLIKSLINHHAPDWSNRRTSRMTMEIIGGKWDMDASQRYYITPLKGERFPIVSLTEIIVACVADKYGLGYQISDCGTTYSLFNIEG